jgi:hypothetical protein
MQHSMYLASAPVFTQGLTGLRTGLEKAAAHVAARKLDPTAFLLFRLYPDMFHFTKQVQAATDFARGATARLAGQEPARYEGDDTSFEGLIARVDAALAYVASFDAAAIEGSEDLEITLARKAGPVVVKGHAYLLQQALPNFYFHITTAYAILRHNGVELTKGNFLGAA